MLVAGGMDPGRVVAGLAGPLGATHLPGVPALYERLSVLPPPVGKGGHRVECAYSAGSPLPGAVREAMEERWGLRVGQLYGTTETGSITLDHPADAGVDPRSVGLAFPGVRVRVVDPATRGELARGEEGELVVEAASMMRGYVDGATPWEAGGGFATGDLARLDATGRLFITGRLKLLIDVGGRKVNPAEVEAVLLEHPSVGGAAVVPLRQTACVERVRAVVEPRAGHAVEGEEVRRWCRERLPGWMVPRVVEVRERLPRTGMGKVVRGGL